MRTIDEIETELDEVQGEISFSLSIRLLSTRDTGYIKEDLQQLAARSRELREELGEALRAV